MALATPILNERQLLIETNRRLAEEVRALRETAERSSEISIGSEQIESADVVESQHSAEPQLSPFADVYPPGAGGFIFADPESRYKELLIKTLILRIKIQLQLKMSTEAEECALQATECASSLNLPHLISKCLYWQARALMQGHKWISAEQALLQATYWGSNCKEAQDAEELLQDLLATMGSIMAPAAARTPSAPALLEHSTTPPQTPANSILAAIQSPKSPRRKTFSSMQTPRAAMMGPSPKEGVFGSWSFKSAGWTTGQRTPGAAQSPGPGTAMPNSAQSSVQTPATGQKFSLALDLGLDSADDPESTLEFAGQPEVEAGPRPVQSSPQLAEPDLLSAEKLQLDDASAIRFAPDESSSNAQYLKRLPSRHSSQSSARDKAVPEVLPSTINIMDKARNLVGGVLRSSPKQSISSTTPGRKLSVRSLGSSTRSFAQGQAQPPRRSHSLHSVLPVRPRTFSESSTPNMLPTPSRSPGGGASTRPTATTPPPTATHPSLRERFNFTRWRSKMKRPKELDLQDTMPPSTRRDIALRGTPRRPRPDESLTSREGSPAPAPAQDKSARVSSVDKGKTVERRASTAVSSAPTSARELKSILKKGSPGGSDQSLNK